MIADVPRNRRYLQRRYDVARRRLAKDLRRGLVRVHDFVSVDHRTVLNEAHTRGLVVEEVEELLALPLTKRDALAQTFIQSAKIWSAGEGASLGAAGIVSVPADVVALVTTNLRMIQSIAAAYGIRLDNPNGRVEAWLPILAALEADPVPEKWHKGPSAPPRDALSKTVGEVAKRFATRLLQREKVRAVPLVGAVAGGVSNYAFTASVAALAQTHFRDRAEAIGSAPPKAAKTRKKAKSAAKRAKKKSAKKKRAAST